MVIVAGATDGLRTKCTKRVTLTIMAWCDNPSPTSVGHPDTPQYRTRHEFIPLRTSESFAIANSRPRPEKIINHCIFLVFLILFQREVPSHIFALYYPKSIQFLAITDPVHRTVQPGTTHSLLPDRNPLREDSFPYVTNILATYS
jgi:hypothetical protein